MAHFCAFRKSGALSLELRMPGRRGAPFLRFVQKWVWFRDLQPHDRPWAAIQESPTSPKPFVPARSQNTFHRSEQFGAQESNPCPCASWK